MPRPSQKDKIHDAAIQCFAELGYDATRVRHIAERASVSEGALYRHYTSKEAIAQEIYVYHLQMFSAKLQEIADSGQPVEEQLREAIREALASYRANPAVFTFLLLRQPTFMPQLPPDTAFPMDVLEKIIIAGQGAGVIRAGQPNLLAAIFFGCLLRPIILSQLACSGALDLLHEHHHDQIILDAAWAAVANPKNE